MCQNSRESINNFSLIENNLCHLQFELERGNRSYFRIAKESHQTLYRAMVEALRRNANLDITGFQTRDRTHIYKMGDEPVKTIHKTEVDGCKKAWRFSEPELCEPPKMDYNKSEIPPSSDYLIHFYDLLAMIQTEDFMKRMVYSQPVKITDNEMRSLEWLHECIRNRYEHFVPGSYSAPKRDLIDVSILCIEKSIELIYGPGDVIPSLAPENLKTLFENVRIKLNELLEEQNL